MRLARQKLASPDGPVHRILVLGEDNRWQDIRAHARSRLIRQGATAEAASRIATAIAPGSMSAALASGDLFFEAAQSAATETIETALVENPTLTNALDPASYRDFMVFQDHFSFGFRWQNKPIPDAMYEFPVSYAGDPQAFLGQDDVIPWPGYSQHLDYELELGIVIAKQCTNVTPDEALDYVLGLTILNDVSARDIQAREMTAGLGPSKGKHFASVVGPVITTLDALPQSGLRMRARVNSETWCDASSAQMVWSIAEIVAWASQGEVLRPGTLLGTGTCNGGSTIETGRRLAPGDVIEFEVEGLGRLRNTLGQPAPPSWSPKPRPRGEDGYTNQFYFLSSDS